MALVIGFVLGSLLSSLVIAWHYREDCSACKELAALQQANAEQLRQIQDLLRERRDAPRATTSDAA